MFNEWQDSLRVESVITKSTHFVALLEYPRNSPHRAAWVSFFNPPVISDVIFGTTFFETLTSPSSTVN